MLTMKMTMRWRMEADVQDERYCEDWEASWRSMCVCVPNRYATLEGTRLRIATSSFHPDLAPTFPIFASALLARISPMSNLIISAPSSASSSGISSSNSLPSPFAVDHRPSPGEIHKMPGPPSSPKSRLLPMLVLGTIVIASATQTELTSVSSEILSRTPVLWSAF